jgi:hypothetical protein
MTHHPQLADKTMISRSSATAGAGAGGGRGRRRGRRGRDALFDETDALLDDVKRESEALAAALTEARQQANKLHTELERERITHREDLQIVKTYQSLSLEKELGIPGKR